MKYLKLHSWSWTYCEHLTQMETKHCVFFPCLLCIEIISIIDPAFVTYMCHLHYNLQVVSRFLGNFVHLCHVMFWEFMFVLWGNWKRCWYTVAYGWDEVICEYVWYGYDMCGKWLEWVGGVTGAGGSLVMLYWCTVSIVIYNICITYWYSPLRLMAIIIHNYFSFFCIQFLIFVTENHVMYIQNLRQVSYILCLID